MVTILKNNTIEDYLRSYRNHLNGAGYIRFLHRVKDYGIEGKDGFFRMMDVSGFFDRHYDEINETLLAILDEGGVIEFEGDFKIYAVEICIKRILPKLIEEYYKEDNY